MARPDAEPVNTPNPALQAKLSGASPAPAEPAPQPAAPVEAPASPPPAQPPQGADAGQEPAAPAPAEPTPQGAPAEPAGEAVLPAPDPVPAVKWQATGIESLDTVGALFDEKGVDGSTALEEFTKYGEISQETYDGLVEKLGVHTANLIHTQFKSAVGELKAAAQKEATKIFEAVGGKEHWDQVAAWSKSAALSEDERNEYNSLLKAGGKAAQLAAKELKDRMMADPNFKSRADLVGSAGTPAGNGQAAPAQLMDRATYNQRIREAENRGDREAAAAIRQAGLHAKQHNKYWKVGNPK